MRYTAAIVVGVVAITVLVVVAGCLVTRLRQRAAAVRERDERAQARELALWEDYFFTQKMHTVVVVRKVARHGSWSEHMGQQTVGQVSAGSENYTEELDALWSKARERAHQLNFGRPL